MCTITREQLAKEMAPEPATVASMALDAMYRRERMLKELMSDLSDLVRSGDITDMQANEWYNKKADQWVNGIG